MFNRSLAGNLEDRWREYKRNRYLFLLFLPGFALFLLFNYVPLYGIMIAFKEYRVTEGILGSAWAGLEHFNRLLAGEAFLNALRNTIIIALLKMGFGFPAPIALALLLNELRLVWFRRVVQTVTYLPHFFSWVILAGILFVFLGSDGAMNKLVGLFGLERQLWLLEPDYFYGIVVLTDIWQSIGWGSIIYFAALASIDPTLYEAAIADGASRWRRVWHISLPSMMPTIITLFLLQLGNFLTVGFDQIYNLTTATTLEVGEILDTYVLRRLLTMDYELGMAAGLFNSVIGILLVVTANRLVKWYDREQGLW
ncbi:sugar ABC transporter permease [Paenibacillus sp. IB182496]|uniref:Sugar ABC transporter permease n=1 Tax=Paenibacillus sabuli TaxID=2772509 RepID=A0A927GTM3_9BACL|nr:ABC transporter permease subunit [Paenibacillus sabuli]MBD2847245.1 sugar ABC transporter permease [Paenibacillus sabuli]